MEFQAIACSPEVSLSPCKLLASCRGFFIRTEYRHRMGHLTAAAANIAVAAAVAVAVVLQA